MNNKTILTLTFLTFSLALNSAVASNQESLGKLKTITSLLKAKGFTCRNQEGGKHLKTGDSYLTYMNLDSKNTYILAAAGSSKVKDINIALHDEKHNTIARDKESSAIPMVPASPKWSDRFHAKVTMAKGEGHVNFMVCKKKK